MDSPLRRRTDGASRRPVAEPQTVWSFPVPLGRAPIGSGASPRRVEPASAVPPVDGFLRLGGRDEEAGAEIAIVESTVAEDSFDFRLRGVVRAKCIALGVRVRAEPDADSRQVWPRRDVLDAFYASMRERREKPFTRLFQ